MKTLILQMETACERPRLSTARGRQNWCGTRVGPGHCRRRRLVLQLWPRRWRWLRLELRVRLSWRRLWRWLLRTMKRLLKVLSHVRML